MDQIDRGLKRELLTGRMTRREFIVRAAAAGVSMSAIAGWLAACAPAPAQAPAAAAPAATDAPAADAPAAEAPAAEEPMKLELAPGTKLTLKLRASFIPEGNQVLSALIADWAAKNNLEVEADIVSMDDLSTIAATAAETGSGPDIVEIYVSQPHLYADKLEDVSDVADYLGENYGGWYPFSEDACKVDGVWRALPSFISANTCLYRTDLFEDIGYTEFPKTWYELLEAGKKMVAAGHPPFGHALGHAVGDGNDFAYTLLWSFGGKEVSEDGKTVTINSPETEEAVEFLKEYAKVMAPDILAWDDSSNNRAYLAGEISMTNNAASIYVVAKTNAPDIYPVTAAAKYPDGPAGRVHMAELMSRALFKYSPNKDAAKALLKHLMEKDQLAPWVQAGYTFTTPLLMGYEELPAMPWNTNPALAGYKGIANGAHLPGYPSKEFSKATEIYNKFIIIDMFAKAAQGEPTKDVIAWAEGQLKSVYEA